MVRRFFVQGFFRQRSEFMKACEPGQVAISSGEHWFMFAGVIYEGSGPDAILTGDMTDQFGPSGLSLISVTSTELRFSKRYLHDHSGTNKIEYAFRKKGDYWFGTYQSPVAGDGVANCVLTELKDIFFQFQPG